MRVKNKCNTPRFSVLGLLIAAAFMSACRQDMHDQPRYEPLEASDFFDNGQSSRMPVAGTIARGHLRDDEHLFQGKINGELARSFPMEVDRALLEKGRERYDIFCTPCHDSAGYGNGIIVSRGFKQPPSLHIDRLRNESEGHYFDVITNGLGTMYSYASRVEPRDRWAIIAYIRALQLSQNATIAEVPSNERSTLEGGN